MGLFSWIGEALSMGIEKPIEAVGSIINRKEDLDYKRDELDAQKALAVSSTNTAEAQSESWLARSWRPLTALGLGACIAFCYIPQFLVADYMWLKMCLAQNKLLPYPLDPHDILELMWGLLGFGAYRTAEKFKGVK